MKTSNLLKAILIMMLGILLCISAINPSEIINWLISIGLLVAGVTMIVSSLILMRTMLSDIGMFGALALAIGLMFLPCLPGTISIDWMRVISMIMMVVGSVLMVDSVIGLVYSKKKRSQNVILLMMGITSFALGICLWLLESFREFAGLMLGIIMLVYSILLLISIFSDKEIVNIDISKREK